MTQPRQDTNISPGPDGSADEDEPGKALVSDEERLCDVDDEYADVEDIEENTQDVVAHLPRSVSKITLHTSLNLSHAHVRSQLGPNSSLPSATAL